MLVQSVLRNHPLVDGNKRLSWMSAFTFYGLNGLDLDAPEDVAYDLVIALATSAVGHAEAADRLGSWCRSST
ncbi:hypothetical protein GCM10010171_01970 [Actinokineospora fastidiosa]|uniref:Fido domain-containing protein n=1 Tax=Actinokineospora fastidiosa TaxID=1816 RepID=A0A918G1T4_9PSEU|nr:hypothetical protein [Actinokineospora fastidiosa]GGS13750.1 hypothetical protein GCM10010171_01970 [Actinokineospora fastidiosa]